MATEISILIITDNFLRSGRSVMTEASSAMTQITQVTNASEREETNIS